MRSRQVVWFKCYRWSFQCWEDWYSICSKHRVYDENCSMCQAGHWVNRIQQRISSLGYNICPWAWRWWVNRPNSPTRKRLEELFPRLKK